MFGVPLSNSVSGEIWRELAIHNVGRVDGSMPSVSYFPYSKRDSLVVFIMR